MVAYCTVQAACVCLVQRVAGLGEGDVPVLRLYQLHAADNHAGALLPQHCTSGRLRGLCVALGVRERASMRPSCCREG